MNQSNEYYLIELNARLGAPERDWQLLQAFALETATVIEFAEGGRDRPLPESLKPFVSSHLSTFNSRWRWQSKQWGYATFYRFMLTDELKAYIRTVRQLDQWIFSNPEDPTFYVDVAERPILWSISHEQMAFVALTQAQQKRLSDQGLALTLHSDQTSPTQQ